MGPAGRLRSRPGLYPRPRSSANRSPGRPSERGWETARRCASLPDLVRLATLLWSLAAALTLPAVASPTTLAATAGPRLDKAVGGPGVRTGSARTQPAAPAPPLTFGIYPGGGAGTIGPGGPTAPEDPTKQLAALRQLRPAGRPFVLHLYASYSGPGSRSPAEQAGQEIAQYTDAGFQTELVLTYRPGDHNPAGDVPAFAAFARSAVHSFGPNPAFVALQVTNEANIGNAPNAADGYYAGAQDALIHGVIAAKAEARKNGFDQVAVGFNWAYSLDAAETGFWHSLGKRGGAAFRHSLDWVGLDVYPGTWGPKTAGGDLAAEATRTMLDSLTTLRSNMLLAGLAPSVPLHVSENGYPTGPKRTEAMQVTVMRAAIAAVSAHRTTDTVTDYRWFDLRDADSSHPSFESGYGLLRDDYTPKAGFAVFRNLVATLGAT